MQTFDDDDGEDRAGIVVVAAFVVFTFCVGFSVEAMILLLTADSSFATLSMRISGRAGIVSSEVSWVPVVMNNVQY